ncbi:hypothetical protein AHF37_09190 [Paragonimus kellicotti]|nr:hypothetical protein AHF37_09190 [Paragonimus kellicotti]
MLTGSYKGATNSCNRHGFGFYKYGRGFYRYEGEWKEGQKHGFGKLIMADGSFYTGQFDHGEITGIGTQYYASTGNTYEGKFRLGERQGQGIMRYKNGSAYCGEWVANARQGWVDHFYIITLFLSKDRELCLIPRVDVTAEGFGPTKKQEQEDIEMIHTNYLVDFQSSSCASSRTTDIHIMLTGSYKGATNSCNRHGFGFYKYGRGFYRYEGEWKEGQKHGFGKLIMADGSFYTGQFDHGEITGIGTQYYASTGNTYEGKFRLGERQGQGIMRYKNGSAYCGEWVTNARQGQGTLFDTEGGCYCGRFWANKKAGTGRYRNDKIVYDGDWCDNLFDGIGKLEFSTGQTYEGCFHAGKPHGHGTLIRAHRNSPFFVGSWEDGKPCSEAHFLTVCSNIPSKEPISSKQAEFLPFGEADFSLEMPTTVHLSIQATVLNYTIPQSQMIEGFALTLCVQSKTNTIFSEESNRQLLLWIGRRLSDEREAGVVMKFHVNTPTSPMLDFLSQTGTAAINSPM